MSKKTITCNKCGASGLSWGHKDGRWVLANPTDGSFHECPVREIKEVKCIYCNADDLWWSKEIMENGETRSVLTESYGLPHACDERRKHYEALSQAKKDEYAREKERISAIPDNSPCVYCSDGVAAIPVHHSFPDKSYCQVCGNRGKITKEAKKRMLWKIRQRIWPNIGKRR